MKKVGILIVIILLCIIILFTVIKKNKPGQVQYVKESINNNKNNKIETFVEELKQQGVILSDKTEIFSEEINEDGYLYNINNETIEIYNVSYEKMKNIIVEEKNEYEVIIKTIDGSTKYAIYYREILILDCRKNNEKILSVLYKGYI